MLQQFFICNNDSSNIAVENTAQKNKTKKLLTTNNFIKGSYFNCLQIG